VEFDGDPAYRDALQLGMETAFGGGDGFRLVFGPGLTRREETLTWMTVRARVQERKQRYLEEGGLSGFSLPDSVRVVFDIDKRHEVPTAWDGLQPLSAAVELPEHFRVREGEIRSLAQTEEAAHREKLNNAVQEAAAGLPAFEIAPGVAAEGLSVMRDGRLRKKDGHTLALLDPARFEREVRNAVGAVAAEDVPALLELIVENDLGELETWVKQMLREADPRLRAELLRVIEARPWYADGRPLLALLQFEEPRAVAGAAELLAPLLVDEGVREAFLRQMDRTEGYAREALARVYAEQAPIPALELCEEWVTDQNERLAAAVFAALHRRAPELAQSTIRLKYDRAPLQVREHMMLVYRFDPATYVRRDGRVVAMALEDEQSATLRRHALKQLYGGVAATPTGWEALQRAAAKEEWGREAPRMRRALVEAVDTAFPDRAEAVYLAELKDSEHNLQAVAVHEAAQFEGETPSVWAELARRARSSDWDAQTWGGALRAIQAGLSGGSLRADNPDLVAVAEAMATHPERTVRWRVVSLLRAALSREGGEGFLPVAEQMARSEPDPKLRRRLERITGSYGKRQRREAE
jgi:hypothetical protein